MAVRQVAGGPSEGLLVHRSGTVDDRALEVPEEQLVGGDLRVVPTACIRIDRGEISSSCYRLTVACHAWSALCVMIVLHAITCKLLL